MKNEQGYTLIGVLIALTILGVIAVAFLGALATASNALIVTDKHATAESLARTEMEYVKKQDYSLAPWSYELPSGTSPTGEFPDWWDEGNPHTLPPGYDNYSVTVNVTRLDPQDDDYDSDDGLQLITITVTHLEDDEVIILEGYKTS